MKPTNKSSTQVNVVGASRVIIKCPYALWIGVLLPHKKPLDMLAIARALPEMEFIMVGAPADKRILNRLSTHTPRNLRYLGSVSDEFKEYLIRRCSVGLTTSEYEGFGWTPLEFLSAGKPVIAYPLQVFREVYGDLVTYANNVTGFIHRLKNLQRTRFRVEIDDRAVDRVRSRYDFSKAASRLIKRLNPQSLTILASDLPSDSSDVVGMYLVDWQLWKSLICSGINVQVHSNGAKFSKQFGLSDRTLCIGPNILFLRRRMLALRHDHTVFGRLTRQVLFLCLMLLEPCYYVTSYVRNRGGIQSDVVIGRQESTLFAAVLLKLIYHVRTELLVHDTDFYKLTWESRSLPLRLYYSAFVYCLRFLDQVTVVSKSTMNELLTFYPYREKISLLWGE